VERFIRPEASVLPESALVPEKNLISPAPNQFTHELIRKQPYYFGNSESGSPPDGFLAEGTKLVLLLYGGGSFCRVSDAQGLYVEIEYAGLRKL
jgi:hypothetical protein